MKNFDEAVIELADGRRQRLTHEEFYKLPLINRVTALCELRVKFFREGKPVPAAEAVKT